MAESGLELPKQIGPYRLERRLGAGGMGEVYKAIHEKLNREVALKILRPSAARNETLFRRFQNEARAAAMPHHPNIVIFFENGSDQGYHYLAFERVRGNDLLRIIEKYGRLPAAFALHVVKQVARALDHAHKHGFVHRDIKPSNILITHDKTVKLTDMGLARQLEDLEDTRITKDGTTVGTVDYMSPEQAKNSHEADIRSDLYSLGCTWFHMLAGAAPYSGGTATERVIKHLNQPIPNLHDHNPKVSDDTAFVIEKLMQKNPDSRFQTPAELLEELNQLNVKGGRSELTSISELALSAGEAETLIDEVPKPANAPQVAMRRSKQVDPVWLFIGLGSAVVVLVLLVLIGLRLGQGGAPWESSDNDADDPYSHGARPRTQTVRDDPPTSAPTKKVSVPAATRSTDDATRSGRDATRRADQPTVAPPTAAYKESPRDAPGNQPDSLAPPTTIGSTPSASGGAIPTARRKAASRDGDTAPRRRD